MMKMPGLKRIAYTKRQVERGFTLIEFVVVLVILVIISGGIIHFTNPVMDLWNYQAFYNGPGMEGRLATLRMVREINQVRNRASVTTADATQFQFTNTNNNNINFDLNAGSLERNNIPLATGVSQLQFLYFDANNAAIATPIVSPAETDIRRIEITLGITAQGRTRTARSQAYPRNLIN